MGLSRAEVEKVSLLARLRLNESELQKLTRQLGQIVEYVEQLEELETAEVVLMAHAVELRNVLVEDRVGPSLDRDAALQNAPKRDEECYRVPAVLGD